MMNPVIEDIKDLLEEGKFGTFNVRTGWSIYLNAEPDHPDTTITLFDIGGPAPAGYYDRGHAPTRNSGFQIRVRGFDHVATWRKIRDIEQYLKQYGRFKVLPKKTEKDQPDVTYAGIISQTDIMYLTLDTRERHVWVVRMEAVRE